MTNLATIEKRKWLAKQKPKTLFHEKIKEKSFNGQKRLNKTNTSDLSLAQFFEKKKKKEDEK